MNRQQKLDKLNETNKQKADQKESVNRELISSLKDFQSVLESGVDIKDTNNILDALKSLDDLKPTIEQLEKTLASISIPEIPKKIELSDIDKLLKHQVVDLEPIKSVSKELKVLTKAITKIKAPNQSQLPEEFVPMRRVVKVDGVGLLFDDSFYTGGGGGSSIPTVNGAVPVVNPDGSNISGGAGGGLTDTELRASPVNVNDTYAVIDSNNSTTNTLGSSATFTGIATDVSDYESVTIHLISDKASATDGVKFQISSDGVNWDHSHSYTYSSSEAGAGIHFEESLPGKYFRLVYVNTSSAQTYFRLQTKLYKNPASSHVHAIDEQIYTGHPAPITRAVITGQTTAGGGALVNVKVNPSGTLETNANIKVGGSDVSNSVPVPISDAGGSVTVDGTFWQSTQPVSAASLPLPSGAATSAKQDTGNTSVASIDTNTAYKFAPGKLRYTNIITSSTTITPTSGKAIRVINVQVVPASANASDVTIYINFATSTIDVFKGYAGGGYGIFTGATNEVLTITQTGTGSVQVLVDYLEI